MSSEEINMFIEFVNIAYDHGQTFHKMVKPYTPRNYKRYHQMDESRDDIQIIYFESDRNGIRYYFIVHYDHLERVLYIYDSSKHNNIIRPEVKDLLERLYPSVRSGGGGIISFAIIQPHNVPSGLFSIAVATALIFGISPKNIQLQSPEAVWRHLEQIFHQGKITPFPMFLANAIILPKPPTQQNPSSRKPSISSRPIIMPVVQPNQPILSTPSTQNLNSTKKRKKSIASKIGNFFKKYFVCRS